MRTIILCCLGVLALLVGGCGAKTGNPSRTPDETVEMNGAMADGDPTASNALPPDPMIFCDEVKRRTTKADCDDLTNTAASAKDGTAAFNVPDMVRGQASLIQLAISLDPPAAATGDAMTGGDGAVDNETSVDVNAVAPDPAPSATPTRRPSLARAERPADVVKELPGRVEQYSPLVGRDMRAVLVGEGFTITARGPASQTLSPGGTTTWEWEVTPLQGANHALTVKTAVEGVMANGDRVVLGSTTRTRTVKVKVRWYDWLRDGLSAAPGWIALVTGVLAALTALVVAWRKLRGSATGAGDGGK